MQAIKLPDSRPAQLGDHEVVARVLGGETGLFEILMRRYNQRMYRVLRSYLKDPADVQDAMQEAYIKAYGKLDTFKGGSAFSTWLVRIGINEALQRLKRARSRMRHVDPDLRSDDLQELPDGRSTGPEEQIVRNEQHAMLERAIDNLPEAYRVVYMLREVEEASVAETAQALGMTESNVKVRLHRAKALLKEELFEMQARTEAFAFGNAHCDAIVAAVMARIAGSAR